MHSKQNSLSVWHLKITGKQILRPSPKTEFLATIIMFSGRHNIIEAIIYFFGVRLWLSSSSQAKSPCSWFAEFCHMTSQFLHIWLLEWLQHKLLGSFLKAPTSQTRICLTIYIYYRTSTYIIMFFRCHSRFSHDLLGNYLLIRVGTFSEDIITTGTSLIVDDSCMMNKKYTRNYMLCWADWLNFTMWSSQNIWYFNRKLIITLIFLRSSYPVIPGMQ